MKNITSFLEALGKSSDLRLENVDFESILNNEDFDEETKNAILSEDPAALQMLLNARSKIVCLLVPAKDDDDDAEDDDDSEEIKRAVNSPR